MQFCSVLFLALLRASSSETPEKAFDLKAEIQEALAGGPVIVKLRLTYQGKEPIEIADHVLGRRYITVTASDRWERREQKETFSGILYCPRTLKQGDELVETVHLHSRYAGISAGPAELTFLWGLSGPAGRQVFALAEPTVELKLDIPSATPSRIEATRARLQAVLDRMERENAWSYRQATYLVNAVTFTGHHEFGPLTLRLLRLWRKYEVGPKADDLRSSLYAYAKQSFQLRRDLVKYLSEEGSREDQEFFDEWQYDEAMLSAQEIETLLRARDLSIRVWTYRNWPDKCEAMRATNGGQEVKKQLLDELDRLRLELESAGRKPDKEE